MTARRWRFFVPALLALALLVIGIALLGAQTTARAEGPPEQDDTPLEPSTPQPINNADGTIDVGPLLRSRDLGLSTENLDSLRSQLETFEAAQAGGYDVGDTRIFAGLDNYNGFYFLTLYEVRLISDTVEVWVQQDLSYPSPVHPDSNDPEYVTQDRVVELATAFEDVIYPTDVDYFGAYDSLTGTQAVFQDLVPSLELPPDYFVTDDGQRTIILVQNVRDANYYDPANNPSFIAGFFSPTFENWADRNIITIDSKQWNRRVGPPDFDYEAVIVHELQHLINADYDEDEESWANEARSEFSEFIAGYRPTPDEHRTTWSEYPENSLTLWGDQDGDPDQTFEILADYQQAYWFFLYMTGRLIDDAGMTPDQAVHAVAATTMDPENGVASLNAMLSDVGASFTFGDLWYDFRTDMTRGGTSDATAWGDYISTYSSTSGIDVAPLDLGRLRRKLDFEGYDTPGAPPNGSDYIELGWSGDINPGDTVSLTGETEIPTSWSDVAANDVGVTPTGAVTGNVLYSGHSDLTDNFVIFDVNVPSSGDQTLSFDTLYNIEADWDFGFVQVTTDTANATGFTSLAVNGTTTATNPSAHPVIQANVPGFSGVSGGGSTPSWQHVEYDLSAYAGANVLLAFRYSTDWASAGNPGVAVQPGWYLDNVSVGGTDLYTDTLPADAQSIWQARNNTYDFAVNFVTYADGNGDAIDNVYSMTLTSTDGTLQGTFDLGELLDDPGFDEAGERALAVVSAVQPDFDADDLVGAPTSYPDYTFEGLPPSIYTSRMRLFGTAAGSSILRPRVYPGDNISVTVTVDNLGRNDDLQTTDDTDAYVGVPIPPNTSFVSGSLAADVDAGNAMYAADLSTVDSGLPAQPGVYWHGTVSKTANVSFAVQVSAPISVPLTDNPDPADMVWITPEAHIANGAFSSNPSQEFVDTAEQVTDYEYSVGVISPLEFSTASSSGGPVPTNGVATFEYTLVNTDDASREVDFRFSIPEGTSLEGLSIDTEPLEATSVAQAGQDEVQLRLNVPSFLETGDVKVVTVELRIDEPFDDTSLTLVPEVLQPGSDIPYVTLTPDALTVLPNPTFLPIMLKAE